MIRFTIPGEPVPKARARKGKHGNFYTPARTRAYEDTVRWHAKLAMRGRKRFTEAVEVEIALVIAEGRFDLDNAVKSILDALNDIIIIDDDQVYSLKASKAYSNNPRAEICIRPLDEAEARAA